MAPERRRRPRLARDTIVGWMLLVLFVSLLSVVIVVRESLHLSVTDRANADVSQEIEEFRTFTQEGVDPETSRPFTSAERLLRVYLTRQRPGAGEIIVGYVGQSGVVTTSHGAGAPSVEEYDLTRDPEVVAAAERATSGTLGTPAGEMRWARTVVDVPGGDDAMLLVAVFTDGPRAEADRTVRTLTFVSLGALLFAGVVSWLVAGRLLRPVRLVHEAAEEITEQDLTRRIDIGGDDDVSGLASTFNRMLDRLEEAFRAEQRFVDDAGHELRTPITVIRGHLELMDDDPESRAATLRIVTQELDRMGRIVSDLLALAKADRPDFIRAVDGVDVAALTVALDAKTSALAERRWQLSGIAEGSAALDAQRVTQAVLQLAQNAVQHTRAGDVITLGSQFATDADGRVLRITIEDTGPGVPVAERERIFERFSHGEPPDGRRHSGAGLGLAIVRAIAEGHGGRVEVGGEPGVGALFALVLPVHDSAGRDDESDDTRETP